MDWLWTTNLATGSFLAGLVAFVHVVHYPLFRQIHPDAWRSHHAEHVRRTTWIVAPAMLLDAGAAVAWALHRQDAAAWVALGCVLVAWIVTFAGAVPAHNRLAAGFDGSLHRKLMWFNLLRLGAWIARLAALLAASSTRVV